MRNFVKTAIILILLINVANIGSAQISDPVFKIQEEIVVQQSTDITDFIPGEIIVQFKDDVQFNMELGKLNSKIENIDALNLQYDVYESELFSESSDPLIKNIYKLKFSCETDINEVINDYQNNENVIFAEPNFVFEQYLIPNDSNFTSQWHLDQQNDCDVDAPEAWDITTGNSNIGIAIIDTGVETQHEDLIDKIIPSDTTNDWNGHGTFCAGVAAASTNNELGIAGMAYNCKIKPYLGLTPLGLFSVFLVSSAIKDAANTGIKVISMSLGRLGVPSITLDNACEYATQKDVTIIAASGNDDSDIKHYPAANENVIAVSATDENDNKADFSNYGSWVDLSAPGVDIFSTFKNNNYITASGTSAACPVVSGIAALLLSVDPTLKPLEIKTILRSSCDPVNSDFYLGIGRVNAKTALEKIAKIIVNLNSNLDEKDVSGIIDIKGTVDGDDFQSYILEIGKGDYPQNWEILKISGQTISNDVIESLDTTSLSGGDGLYTIRLRASAGGNQYEDRVLFRVDNIQESIKVDDNFLMTVSRHAIKHYNSIKKALRDAGNKDDVYVYSGQYNENIHLADNRNIKFEGEDRETTIVKNIVSYSGGIDIEKFNISNIEINSPISGMIRFNNNIVRGTKIDIHKIENCKMTNNEIINCSIELFSSNGNNLSGNHLHGYSKHGIKMDYSSNNDICDNIIEDRDIAIEFKSGDDINSMANFFNLIINNSIKNNNIGLKFVGKNKLNWIVGNDFENNLNYGAKFDEHVKWNRVYHNNYKNNGINCYDAGINTYHKTITGEKNEGNYWDDYSGKDRNGDGIGDTPYNIDGGINFDWYPLMQENDNVLVSQELELIYKQQSPTSE